MAGRSIRAFHERVAYTTQTFDQRRGFNFVRLITGVLIVAIAGTAAVVFTPLSETARLLALRGSPLEQQSLATVAPGEIAEYSVRFRNTGLVTWERGTTDVVLAVKDDSVEFAGAGLAIDWLSANRIAATLEPSVAPGAVGTFAFKLRAPATTGVYRSRVSLVADGEKWLSEDAVVVLASDYGFHSELVDQTQHPNLRPGESSTLTVRVANTGTRTWSRGLLKQQVNLGLDGDDKTASALGIGWPSADRVAVQSEPQVAPGAIASFTFRVRAPAAPGIYPLRLRPVVDGVTWMEPTVLSLISVGATRLSEGTTATTTTSPKQPSFAMSVAVDRSSVAPGQAVNLVASYTGDSPTRAFVGVEILAPMGGVISYGKWWEREFFEAGELRAFPVTWQIPASAMTGPYTVRLRAFGVGWKPLFGFNDAASTISVAQPPAGEPSPPPSAPAATATPPGSTGTPSPTAPPATATPTPA